MVKDSDIKNFVSKMTYWERVNVCMSDYLLEFPSASREEAYNDSMVNEVKDDASVEYHLEKLIRFGSSYR